ncbi:AraC family transcriptional regulator [Paenibacillus sp. R14(2021)]|uniref:helix-turn-helix transcriptional regulator n=1 Tax=Paenibacillus sp. R14(2021) TaxID=2859228 RepID=UPI001C611E39|nr:AraC family transcriptional regulator [Paenibacillus sp. R14(2021)]
MYEPAVVSFPPPPMPYYLECGKSVFQPGEQHPSRSNLRVFDLLILLSGTLYIGEGDKQWALTSGQTLLLLPDRYHYAVQPCREETIFYWMHFKCEGSWEEFAAHNEPLRRPEGEEGGSLHYTIHIPKHWTIPAPRTTYDQMEALIRLGTEKRSAAFWNEQKLFHDILQSLDESRRATYASPSFHVAERTEAYIKQHYASALTNTVLGEALHFHPGYIVRCMKEIYGCTPQDYLLRYRIERAKLLLIKTERAVAAIAEDVGFHGTPYFSVCFKLATGQSPLQYRKQFAAEASRQQVPE